MERTHPVVPEQFSTKAAGRCSRMRPALRPRGSGSDSAVRSSKGESRGVIPLAESGWPLPTGHWSLLLVVPNQRSYPLCQGLAGPLPTGHWSLLLVVPNHVHGIIMISPNRQGRPLPRSLSHNCPGTAPVPFHICSTSAPHLFHEIEPSATRWDKMEQFGTVFSEGRGPRRPAPVDKETSSTEQLRADALEYRCPASARQRFRLRREV